MSDSDSEGGVPLIEAEFDVTANSKKRKAEADAEGGIDSKKEKKKAKGEKKENHLVRRGTFSSCSFLSTSFPSPSPTVLYLLNRHDTN